MLRLQCNELKQELNDQLIFENINLSLYAGDRVGLVGKNGCGKTTLLRTLTREMSAVSGSVQFHGRIGYLPQDLDFRSEGSVLSYLAPWEEALGYYRTMSELKLWDIGMTQLSQLSGGEKTKVFLASLMLSEPDVLLLDEPTNHLDQEGLTFLASFINQFKGAVLMVSHDRYFLNQTVNQILEMAAGGLRSFAGSYDDYRHQLNLEHQAQQLSYEKYERKRTQLELAARQQMERANRYNGLSVNDYQRGKARRVARVAQVLAHRAEMLEEVKRPPKKAKIDLHMTAHEGMTPRFLMLAESLKASYDQLTVFEGVSFQLARGQRVALLGPNGCGKSTLMKGLLGEVLLSGGLKVSPSTKAGYFSQELTVLNPEETLLESLAGLNLPESELRRFLGTVFFKADEVHKKINQLSYGEKSRVAFLKLILGGYNLLLLDEPTNFLDIETREKIEELLDSYEGALVFVSHDRYFVEKMAEVIWRLTPVGLEIEYL